MATKQKTKRLVSVPSLLSIIRRAKKGTETDPLIVAARDLGIPDVKQWRTLSAELACIEGRKPKLGKVYKEAAVEYLRWFEAKDFQRKGQASRVVSSAMRRGRLGACRELGIELMPLGKLDGKGFVELARDDSLLDILIPGDMGEHVRKMAGVWWPGRIEVERAYAAVGIYKCTVIRGKKRRVAFVDETGVEADILAGDLLCKAGMVIPKMKNIPYSLPDGEESEYGVMQDIAQAKGVKHAVSLRGLARDGRLARRVLEDFDGFSEMLGYSLEVCRILGIQDRHDRNLFVIEKKNGELAIGMIDLDAVACYPSFEEYVDAFAGQLYFLVESLVFAEKFGELARTAPEKIKETVESVAPGDAREDIGNMLDRMWQGFVAGAERAHAFFLSEENQGFVKARFDSHHKSPVGVAESEAGLEETLDWISKKAKELVESGKQDGMAPFRTLIDRGPNRGRIRLDSEEAKQGFEAQIIERDANGEDAGFQVFWRATFKTLKACLPRWINEDGPKLEIRTVCG